MRKLLIPLLAFIVLFPISGTYAYTITPANPIDPADDSTIEQNIISYTFNITLDDNEIITGATLSITLYDLGAAHIYIDGVEVASNLSIPSESKVFPYDVYAALSDNNSVTLGLKRFDGPTKDFKFDKATLEVTTQVIPLPSTVLLLGTGLIGLAALGRRRRRRK